jgi:RNA polymerase sigma-70 factor (ECF subfamily)
VNEERDLVERCLAGRESAYHEFVERFQALVYGVSLRMLGDRHEAEDVSQEVFLRALRNLKQWDPTRPLRPWLLTITANRCRTLLQQRRQRPRATPFTQELPAPDPGTHDVGELQAQIQLALQTLRPDYRRVFLLFHEQACSYDEMSRLIGKPVGTVKTWLHRARAEMLEFLRRKGLAEEVRRDLSEV